MKDQLSIQEKLWDLRRDHNYKLEDVAAAVNVVPATISKYENKENKEYNIVTLNKLADFYGVSLEWLVGNTEVRESSLTDIDELMLDDETIECLFMHPVLNASIFEDQLTVSRGQAIRYLNTLEEKHILLSNDRKRGKTFFFNELIDLARRA